MIKRKRAGFTLVEIMIVITIISLLSAISIPNFMRARCTANNTAALGSVKTIITALETWRVTHPDYSGLGIFMLRALGNPPGGGPPYIDRTLAGTGIISTKQGYRFFAIRMFAGRGYWVYAFPQFAWPALRRSGTRYYRYYSISMGQFRGGTIYTYSLDDPGAGWQPIQ